MLRPKRQNCMALHPFRQWSRVRGQSRADVDHGGGGQDGVHCPRLTLGERLCGVVQCAAAGRAAERRDLLLTAGGQDRDRELATTLQPCIGTPIWLCHWREEVLLIGTLSRAVFGVPSGSLSDGLSAG